ncbi:MAG: GyrI-like domain-containing protein [Spirochaetes bacterium]|nr:GyrI-like domain-containing protein [Spirochaetota bacterium]
MKKIIGILVVVISIVLLVLAYFGLFVPIKISEETVGPFWLVYEKYTGDYKNVGPVMDKLYYDLKKDGIETSRGFGIYYDNPEKVDKDKLRSAVGCILENKDESKLDGLKKKYNAIQYPASNCAIVRFPFNGTLSIIIGIMRVYPKLGKYMKDHNYPEAPFIEIYNEAGEEIQYIAPINTDRGFFDSLIK